MLEKHLGLPLTKVPDPFRNASQFGEHNNGASSCLSGSFSVSSTSSCSSTECYKSGRFDQALLKVLARFDDVWQSCCVTARGTGGDLFAVCRSIEERHRAAGPVLRTTSSAARSHMKNRRRRTFHRPVTEWPLQTAVEAGLGHALGAAYRTMRMAGKDMIDSAKTLGEICRALVALRGRLYYELFLDENGQKNFEVERQRLTIEEWLRYGKP